MALHSSLPFPDQLQKQVLEASTPILKNFFSLWDVCWTTLHWVFWGFIIKKYMSWAQEDLRSGQLCSFLIGISFRFNSASSSCPVSCPTRKRHHNYLPFSLSWQKVLVTRVLHISPPSIFHIPGIIILHRWGGPRSCLTKHLAQCPLQGGGGTGIETQVCVPKACFGCTGHVTLPDPPVMNSKPTMWPKHQMRAHWEFKHPLLP